MRKGAFFRTPAPFPPKALPDRRAGKKANIALSRRKKPIVSAASGGQARRRTRSRRPKIIVHCSLFIDQ